MLKFSSVKWCLASSSCSIRPCPAIRHQHQGISVVCIVILSGEISLKSILLWKYFWFFWYTGAIGWGGEIIVLEASCLPASDLRWEAGKLLFSCQLFERGPILHKSGVRGSEPARCPDLLQEEARPPRKVKSYCRPEVGVGESDPVIITDLLHG